ncbi:VWA domain-containing protein [Photobacterium alginatilyticum]|uniref:VWA domain-containing protein n=1 Tax=Photobacterium alginatilyticum TaxID=1775171 RepID=UPI004068BC2B
MFDSQLWQQVWQQFHFIRPLWLLAFIPLSAVVYIRWNQDSISQWQQLFPPHLRKALTLGETGWKKQLPLKVLTLVMVLAIVVCAGPTWQREASPFGEDKASLLVVLDNSDSMLSKDIAPNRLERSKQKIRDLMVLRNGGNTGLVVFAGTAHVAMPLTRDSEVFAPFLAAIDPDIMPEKGKSTQAVIPLIEQQLSNRKTATVLLITDGISPSALTDFSNYFQSTSHQLLVLVAGNPGASSVNPPDVDSLKALARSVGGQVIVMTVDDSDVKGVSRQVERYMQLNNDSDMPWQDMGYYLLFPIAMIMLLWFRKGWLVQWCVLAVICLPLTYSPATFAKSVESKATVETPVEYSWQDRFSQFWFDLWLTPDQQGQWFLNRGDYLKAAAHFQDPFYKGVAYYYAAQYSLAQSAFLQDGSEAAILYAGNALARQREYLAARDLFFELSKKASSPDIRKRAEHNLEVMQGIVEEINRTSESQMGTTDGPEESFELADDQPRTADGADEKVDASMMVRQTLNANEILGSDELADKWLRRVEADPKYFLRAKFQIQRQKQNQTNGQVGELQTQKQKGDAS